MAGVLPVALGVWGLLAVTLGFGRIPLWGDTLKGHWEFLLSVQALDFPGLIRALTGHALALGKLAAILIAAYGAGWPLARLLLGGTGIAGVRSGRRRASSGTSLSRLVGMALQLVFGFSVVSLAQHGLGLSGLLFPGLLGLETAILLAVGIVAVWRLRSRLAVSKAIPRRDERLPFLLTAALLVLAFMLARLPDTHEDARVYHFAAPEQYIQMHKISAEPQNFTWHVALGCEMAFLAPWAFGGILLAKQVNIAFLAATALLLHCLAAALAPGRRAGWWACVWYLSAGLVMDECWQGKNDLAAAMFVSGAALCAAWPVGGRRNWWLGACWLLGAAIGVKYTSAFFLAGLVGALALFGYLRPMRGRAVWGSVLALVPAGGWLVANFVFLGNPFYPFLSGMFDSVSWGPFYESSLHEVIRAFSPPEAGTFSDVLAGVWRVLGDPALGSPGLFALLPLAVLAPTGARRLLLMGCLLAYTMWLPTERVVRYLAPLLPLAAVLVATAGESGLGVGALWLRRGRIVLAGTAAVFAMLNAAYFARAPGLLHLLGQVSSADLLENRFTTWERTRRWVNDNLSVSARVVFTGEERRLWFAPRVISHASVTEPMFWRLAHESFSVRQMRKRVRQRGITHHLHNMVIAEHRTMLLFAGPDWTDRGLALCQEFVGRYERPVYIPDRIDHLNGGFYVFEFRRRPASRALPAMFLPFTEGRTRPAWNLMRAGKLAKARAEARRLVAPYADSLQAQFVLAALAMRVGDHGEALRLLEPGIRAGYVANGNWIYYAAALRAAGRHDEAAKALSRARLIHR